MKWRAAVICGAVLAACSGLLDDRGNDFPCDFSQAEGVRDQACAPQEVCGVNNQCQSFAYEGPRFEGPPQLPVFDGKVVHPKFTADVLGLAPNATSRGSVLFVGVGDGGSALSSVDLKPVLFTSKPAFNVASLKSIALVRTNLEATLDTSAKVHVSVGIGSGVEPQLPDGGVLDNARALRTAPNRLAVLRAGGQAGEVAIPLIAPLVFAPVFTPYDVGAAAGLSDVLDVRFWSPRRLDTDLEPIALSHDGLFLKGNTGWSQLVSSTEDLGFFNTLPLTGEGVFFRHDRAGAVWAVAQAKPAVLSTWVLSTRPEPVFERAWNDCHPCGADGRIAAVAAVQDGTPAVEVLCGNGLKDTLSLTRVIGASSVDGQTCLSTPVTTPFNFSKISNVPGATILGGRALAIDDSVGDGVAVGGTDGRIWLGPSFSQALPIFLERVPLSAGTVSIEGQTGAIALTNSYLAAPFVTGFQAFALKGGTDGVLDETVKASALVNEGQGWAVLSSADLVHLAFSTQSDGGLFRFGFGPRLLDARGNVPRAPYFGEAIENNLDGGLLSFAVAADDSVYFGAAPDEESSSANALPPLSSVLTPEPSSPIRSFTLERTPLGTNGVDRVRGYLVTSRNVYRFELSGSPARWSATPITLEGGEPLAVWMDNPRGGLGRVGYRDGNVFTLPGGYLLARPKQGTTVRVLDYENLGGWPVAYTTTGLFEAHYDVLDGGKLDNKLPNGLSGKPMEWREVKLPDGSRPWLEQFSDGGVQAVPGKLHVVQLPQQQQDGGLYKQEFRLLLFTEDAVYNAGTMTRSNKSIPLKE